MYLFDKIKDCFLTCLSIIVTVMLFFVFSILALIISWILFLFFSGTTIYGIIKEYNPIKSTFWNQYSIYKI
jgi:FtsH-binding integral membrane protein